MSLAQVTLRNGGRLEFFDSHIIGNVKLSVNGYQDVGELDRPALAALRQAIDDILARPAPALASYQQPYR